MNNIILSALIEHIVSRMKSYPQLCDFIKVEENKILIKYTTIFGITSDNKLAYTLTNPFCSFGLCTEWQRLDIKDPDLFQKIDDYLEELSKINIDNL